MPTWTSEIYVRSSSADGFNEMVTLPIDGNTISHTFTDNKNNIYYKNLNALMEDPGCPSGDCDIELSGSGGNVNIGSGQVYCISEGDNFTATQIRFQGGTLRVCGNLIANQIMKQGNNSGTLIISASGTVQVVQLQTNGLDEIINYGTLAESSGPTIASGVNFENHGIFNASGGLVNQSEDFLNTGTINVSGQFNNNEIAVNQGTIIVSGHFNNTGDPSVSFTNQCRLEVTGHFNQNRLFHNYGYIIVGQQTQFTGSGASSMYMHEQALHVTTDLHINGDLIGPDQSCARINISDQTTIAGNGNVSGYIDICDDNGVETNNGTIGPNVTFDCSCYIPQTDCSPGAGDPPYNDDDGDGVPDDDDDYPEDPDQAFDSFDEATLAFEDLWPSMGDYDFNDLVLYSHYQIISNAENSIVKIIAKFKIEAGGASLNNGYGFSLPTAPANVASVTGSELVGGNIVTLDPAGYEAGHLNNTVVIVYDAINTMVGSSIFNTEIDRPYIETDTTTIVIDFDTPQASLGSPPYNAFLFVNGDRGHEIHMIDNAPTSLVDNSLFGESNDDSDPANNRYYVTEANLPWVIQLPVMFDYPIERADIVQTYLKFADWAQSGGTTYTDWYLDNPGYRNEANIYSTYN
ncbi:MAG: LruC domain-containing protein [Bacteroidota bacterium]|nr:LruC domain-containing protein [Bacteroidota bacterium]